MGRIVIMLGPPGAGKGTQAARLSVQLDLVHVSTGDLFRENLGRETPLGLKAREYMDKGALVPDELVLEMLEQRLTLDDCREGCLLDGFPRTQPQAEALERLVAERGWSVSAYNLEVPDGVLVERLSGRRVCRSDGSHIQHAVFAPPRVEGRCDTCGGELYQRDDDNEEVVGKRLEVYHRQTAPLLEFYSARGVLSAVDGNRAPETVLADLQRLAGEVA